MKQCLADVNVILALLVRNHGHHAIARKWFAGLAPDELGLCRHVQLGVMRLLANRTVMGEYSLSALQAWVALQQLLEDERVFFMQEPKQFDLSFPAMLRYTVPTGKLVGDAYLAACAKASTHRITTFDGGFSQFPGIDIEILSE